MTNQSLLNQSEASYVIVAGTTRSGTTSLFNSLSAHPDLTPSCIKQTCYFLDQEIQDSGLESLQAYENGGIYQDFFTASAGSSRFLEASPDYLYSPQTAKRIAKFMQGKTYRLIFILRDPIDRFQSWFHYGKQSGLLSQNLTWEDFYLESCKPRDYRLENIPFLAMQTGLYSRYLKTFYDYHSSENIVVTYVENMRDEGNDYLVSLASKLDLEPSFYQNYSPQRLNANYAVRNRGIRKAYQTVRKAAISATYRSPVVHKATAPIRRTVSALYRKLNASPNQVELLSENILHELQSFYAGESERLTELTEVVPPWRR